MVIHLILSHGIRSMNEEEGIMNRTRENTPMPYILLF